MASAVILGLGASSAQAQSNIMTRHTREDVMTGRAQFLRRMQGTQTLRIDVALPIRDQAGLVKFLNDVYNPASPNYRHFLTVSEFTSRFGPSREDYDAVVHYAENRGLKVVGGTLDSMDIQLVGSVTSIESAFNVSMGVYQHPTEGRTFYAPDREPTVDIAVPIWHISGLDNYSLPHPLLVHRDASTAVKSNATTGSGPSGSYLGSDMRAAYYGTGPLTGSGQNLGLLEYEGYDIADVNTYFTNAKQTNNVPITGISTDGTSLNCTEASGGCDDTEQTLDMTQAISMAPGLSGLYVFVGSSDTAIFGSMTSHTPLCAQLSSSWTWSPADPSTDDPYFERMASQGQNIFQAAGDSGHYTTRSSEVYPADDAYVTSVGGTDVVTSGPGGSWVSETVWVDGGGGISPDKIAIPSYQTLSGVITSTNKGSTTYRNSPDVAGEANFDYYVCADQEACTSNYYGGTSFAAPLWAGYMALANQQYLSNGHTSTLGFINPVIYPIGLGSSYGTSFHDITSGSNGYSAVAGYDMATGWGSMNTSGLINALAGPAGPSFSVASSGSVTAADGTNGSTNITVTAIDGFTGNVTLSASNLPTGVTASFGSPNPITLGTSGTSLLTLTNTTAAPGTYSITVTGTSGATVISTTVSLTVPAPSFTLSALPGTVSVEQGFTNTTTISNAVLYGFSSAITLSASGLPSGVTATFGTNPIAAATGTSLVTFTASSSASTGTKTVTITGTSGSTTASTTVSLTITAAPKPTFTISAGAATVIRGSTTTTTVNTTGVNGFNASISLSVSGLPSGVTASFSPTSIAAPGTGSSTLKFTASSRASTGNHTVTVTGRSGTTSVSTTLTLTVNSVSKN